MTVHWGNHKFIDLLREGDPTATVSVKKPDGTYINIAPLSTLLHEWDQMEQQLALAKASVNQWQEIAHRMQASQ